MENQTTPQEQITKTITEEDIAHQPTEAAIQQLQTDIMNGSDNGNDLQSLLIPQNPVTGKPYRGANVVVLLTATLENHYPTNESATFKQWRQQNEVIRKGEKGTMIVYYDTMDKQVNGETQKIRFLKSSYVFNRSQLKSLASN